MTEASSVKIHTVIIGSKGIGCVDRQNSTVSSLCYQLNSCYHLRRTTGSALIGDSFSISTSGHRIKPWASLACNLDKISQRTTCESCWILQSINISLIYNLIHGAAPKRFSLNSTPAVWKYSCRDIGHDEERHIVKISAHWNFLVTLRPCWNLKERS